MNYDAGETVGWPRFAATVADVYGTMPAADHPVIVTSNYGEAGAIERYRPRLPVYSGHNAYWDWGPPPSSARTPRCSSGLAEEEVEPWCGDLVEAARIDNGVELENDEQGAPVWACRSLSQSWAEIWPQLRRLG